MRTKLSRRHVTLFLGLFVGTILAPVLLPAPPSSALSTGYFSLQVTPSPLVTTLKPGTTTELELKVRNAGTDSEELKAEPRSFAVDEATGKVSLNDTTAPDISSWISFSAPTFTVQSGEWFTEKVRVALPKDTGFSYSFAIVISRKNNPQPLAGGRLIKGSLAVFTLINIDRPGATRKLEVRKLTTNKGVYEYLPATLSMQFKNTGNTIVQPYGNIFIQRSPKDALPISTLPVNDTKGYILPGSNRTLETDWAAGFPAYKTVTQADGTQKQKLIWDWSKLSQLRVGHYTAKLVAVYNDGQRDVPIEQDISFWVIPWKILGGLLVVILLVGFAVWSILRKIFRLFRRIKQPKQPKQPPVQKEE